MTEPAQTLDLGTLGSGEGSLSVAYSPDFDGVIVRASVPGDKRRLEIVTHVSAGALRDLVTRLDQASEKAQRIQGIRTGIVESEDSVVVTVTNQAVSMTSTAYEQLLAVVDAGDNDATRRTIAVSFPSLSDREVSEMAYLIYKERHPRAG
jgi:hypothetical protein